MHQINIIIVFLYNFVDANIYMLQLNDFIKNYNLICYLLKILYDFKQTFRV